MKTEFSVRIVTPIEFKDQAKLSLYRRSKNGEWTWTSFERYYPINDKTTVRELLTYMIASYTHELAEIGLRP
jgi:hypothetical protein